MEIAAIYAKNLQPKPKEGAYVPEPGGDKGFADAINKAQEQNGPAGKEQNAPQAERASKPKAAPPREKVKPREGAPQARRAAKGEGAKEDGRETPVSNEGAVSFASARDAQKAENAGKQNAGEFAPAAPQAAFEGVPLAGVAPETGLSAAPSVQIISGAAAVLGAGPGEITGVLEKLNLEPADLTDGKNLRAFLRAFYNADTNAALLSVPNIGETVSSLQGALNDAAQNAAPSEQTLPETAQNLAALPRVSQESAGQAQVLQVTRTEAPSAAAELSFETEVLPAEQPPVLSGAETAGSSGGESSASAQNPFRELPDGALEARQAGEPESGDAVIRQNEPVQMGGAVKAETKVAPQRMPSPQEVVKQITDFLKTDVKAGVSEVKLLLRPESLGEVSLRVVMENGVVTAQFAAENERVKAILESSMNELKNVLSQAGVDVGALSVSVSGGGAGEAQKAFERELSKPPRRAGGVTAAVETEPEAARSVVSQEEALEATVSFLA